MFLGNEVKGQWEKLESPMCMKRTFCLICSNMPIIDPEQVLESKRLSGMVATLCVTLL